MNGEKLISVIIPIYNNEKYVEGCINSLLSQTYKNIEIIAVNDGSSDSTKNKLEALKERDDRIVVINKKNGGVSSARNSGLEAAQGDYIAFLDSDDEYLPDAFETMLSVLDGNTDLLVCSHRKIWIHTHDCHYSELEITKNELKDSFFEYCDCFHFCWGNLYSAEIIKTNNLRFNEKVHFSEDYEFNLSYIKHTENKLKVCGKIVYNYMIYRSGAHEKRDYPKRDIDVIVDFFGGRDNMKEETFSETVSLYLNRCVNRTMSWYGVKKTAQYVETAFKECGDYISDNVLKYSFSERQAAFLISGDYLAFTKDYFKTHKYNIIDKYRFKLSKIAVKLLKKE